MKIRTGFVSNSSSSNFIIAVPKDDTKVVIHKEFDLLEVAKENEGCCIISTEEELDDLIAKDEVWDDDNEIRDQLKAGKIVIVNNGDPDDDDLRLFVNAGNMELHLSDRQTLISQGC